MELSLLFIAIFNMHRKQASNKDGKVLSLTLNMVVIIILLFNIEYHHSYTWLCIGRLVRSVCIVSDSG